MPKLIRANVPEIEFQRLRAEGMYQQQETSFEHSIVFPSNEMNSSSDLNMESSEKSTPSVKSWLCCRERPKIKCCGRCEQDARSCFNLWTRPQIFSKRKWGLLIAFSLLVLCFFTWMKMTARVVLFGDSLVSLGCEWYDFNGQLANALKKQGAFPGALNIYVRNSGFSAQTIAKMRARKLWMFDLWSPDAVVVLWESDIAEFRDERMTPDQLSEKHRKFRADIGFMLDDMQLHAAKVLVAGPAILIGELPRGTNLRSDTLIDPIIDNYVRFTKDECSSRKIEYLDARSAFFQALPSDWKNNKGYFTTDGEHLNQRGVSFMVQLISKALSAPENVRRARYRSRWFTTKN